MEIKKLFKFLSMLLLSTAVLLTGCGSNNNQSDEISQSADSESTGEDLTVVKVGVCSEQFHDMWEPAIEKLKDEGIDLQVVTITNYTLVNKALEEGEIDLNDFQHYAFLEEEISNFGYDITPIAETVTTPQNLYSKKVKSVDEIKDGDTIVIPQDDVNVGRSLLVLQQAGLLEIDPSAGNLPKIEDIKENPLNLNIVLVDGPMCASSLDEVTAAIIISEDAMDAGIYPDEYAIFEEQDSDANNQYTDIIAARTDEKDSELYKKVVDAYRSDETKDYILENFHGAFVPVW